MRARYNVAPNENRSARPSKLRPWTSSGATYATPYLNFMLGEVLGLQLSMVVAEFTAAAFNPAMATMKPMAERSLARAKQQVVEHAEEIARRFHRNQRRDPQHKA